MKHKDDENKLTELKNRQSSDITSPVKDTVKYHYDKAQTLIAKIIKDLKNNENI